MAGPCLRCYTEFDYNEGECPDCGWDSTGWSEKGRYGLAKEGHGEPEDNGESRDRGRSGSRGPPPGPQSLSSF